jgi:ATP-binding cassette subfamily B protein
MISHPWYGLNGIILEIFFVKVVVDAVQYSQNFETIMLIITGFTLYFVICQFAYNFYIDIIWEKALLKMNYKAQLELIDIAKKTDIKCFDDEKFYDSCMKSVAVFEGKLAETMHYFRLMFCMILSFVFLLSLLFSLNIYIMLLMLGSSALSIFINAKTNKINYNKYLENIKYEKKSNYIKRIFNGHSFAKDLRIYNKFSNLLVLDYKTQNKGKKEVAKKYSKPLFIYKMLTEYLFGTCIYQGIIILIAAYFILVEKTLPYSAFAVIVPSTWALKGSMEEIGSIIPQFKILSKYIEDIKIFFNLKSELRTPEATKPAPNSPESIELCDVSFAYDNKTILKNISLTIQPREKIAIVGENGAGKSTLIKLIMRLYDPQSGGIFLNGVDIQEYDLDNYYNYFSTVFHDYKIFAANIAENVLTDNINEEDTVKNAINLSGFDKTLKSSGGNITSQISKEFDKNGLIFSGGETQKLAISRAFTKKHPILMLDEPSSALDPVSEAEINQKLLFHCGENTVIFISHRLSTTKMADRIIVIIDGEIKEQGSHAELMSFGGKYAEMFALQANNYK